MKKCPLVKAQAWSPATAMWTEEMKNCDKVYMRGKTIDHTAIEIVLKVDVIFPQRSDNIAFIDYNNKQG